VVAQTHDGEALFWKTQQLALKPMKEPWLMV
jgi:hypothetical protein